MLNSLGRFAPGASFPIILNLVLIGALLAGDALVANGSDLETVAYILAWSVSGAGVLQLGWLWFWARTAGFDLALQPGRRSRPR